MSIRTMLEISFLCMFLTVTTPVLSDMLLNPAPQVIFPVPDEVHPEWAFRQSGLGWNAASLDGSDKAEEADAKSCGGVCVLTPEVMEGPFYLDYHLDRDNLTEGIPGVPLQLTIQVYQIASHLSDPSLGKTECYPLPNAWVDIWNCDSEGVYSGYGKAAEEPGHPGGPGGPSGPGRHPPPPGGPGGGRPPHGPGGPGGPGGPPGHAEPQNNSTFLRGIQQSDSEGKVTFNTIYPGWYPGRAIHIHMKVHPPSWAHHDSEFSFESAVDSLPQSEISTGLNETHTHTTQLFFSEDISTIVETLPVYKKNGVKRVKNDEDMLYIDTHGATLAKAGLLGDDIEQGIWAEFKVGVDKWW